MNVECHAECTLAKNGICQPAKHSGMRCNYGRFFMLVEAELSGFGNWKVREYQSGAMCATLHGRAGRVEVWGGDHHANEVWFIEKGTKKETLLCKGWATADDSLVYAVANACALACVQARLELAT